MYIATLTYSIDGATKTFTHNVEESNIHVAEYGHNCNFVIPANALQEDYELLAANKTLIEKVVLADDEGKELYASSYWNRVQSINYAFPNQGEPRCDVQLYHAEPTQSMPEA